MEKEEKLQYAIVLLLSVLAFDYTKFTYTTGFADTLKDLMPWIVVLMLILLGLALILVALDFIAGGVVPDSIISLVTWIYILILGVLILLMAVLNELKL